MLNFRKELSLSQVYGSGLAAVLISLIVYTFTGDDLPLYIALGLIILLMIWPAPFRYFGFVWFSFGEIIGFIVSRLLLSLIYIVLVIPIGLMVRKKIRKNMDLSSFKAGSRSVLKHRDYVFSSKDFEKPF